MTKNNEYTVSKEVTKLFKNNAEYQVYSAQVNIVNLNRKLKEANGKEAKANLELQISALETTMSNNLEMLACADELNDNK
jgi:hypothetical protein